MTLRKTTLKDLFSIEQGYAFKSSRYVKNGKYVLCTLGNISEDNNFKFNPSRANYYPDEFPRRFILEAGDLILPLTEQAVGLFGNSAFIPQTDEFHFVLNQRVGKIVPKSGVSKRYLHYLLSTGLVRQQIEATASGTSQRNTSPEKIYGVTVWVPSESAQESIGDFLFNIEEQINVNNQVNDNLHAMALSQFMHHFFRKEPNGELSDVLIELPKSQVQVRDVKDTAGRYPFFTSGASVLRWDESLASGRNLLLNTGGNADVKFYVGEMAYSTDTWAVTARDNLADYAYLLLHAISPELDQKYFLGTGLRHLQKPLLKKRPIYIPSDAELNVFNAVAVPAMTMISENLRENRQLQELRDWLLPILMNGQATVASSDKLSFT